MLNNSGDLTHSERLVIRCGILVWAVSLGTAVGAVTSWVGSSVFSIICPQIYESGDTLEALKMGAVGGAMLGGISLSRVIYRSISSEASDPADTYYACEDEASFPNLICFISKYFTFSMLAGLLGFAMFNIGEKTSLNGAQELGCSAYGVMITAPLIAMIKYCYYFDVMSLNPDLTEHLNSTEYQVAAVPTAPIMDTVNPVVAVPEDLGSVVDQEMEEGGLQIAVVVPTAPQIQVATSSSTLYASWGDFFKSTLSAMAWGDDGSNGDLPTATATAGPIRGLF